MFISLGLFLETVFVLLYAKSVGYMFTSMQTIVIRNSNGRRKNAFTIKTKYAFQEMQISSLDMSCTYYIAKQSVNCLGQYQQVSI